MPDKKRDYKRERSLQLKREGRQPERDRNKAQRTAKKSGMRKTGDGADTGHKTALKNGGSSDKGNLKKQSRSSNRSEGGKMGSREGKRKGGQNSSRKGVPNKKK